MPTGTMKNAGVLVSACRRPTARPARCRYSVNSEYFKTLTAASAYWLGFLLADGNIHLGERNGSVRQASLCAESKDRDHVQQLADALSATYPVRAVRSWWSLRIPNYELCLSVEPYGIVPAKSYTARPPDLPESLYWHWLRGLVDGDGCFNNYARPSRAVKKNGRGRPATDGRRVLTLCVVGSEYVTAALQTRHGGSVGKKAGVTQWTITGVRAAAIIRQMYAESTPAIWLGRKYDQAVRLGLVEVC